MAGFFGLKKYPGPVAKPMAPFFIAGAVILYGVSKAQTAMMASDEFKDDPRNPNRSPKAAVKH